MPNVKITPQFLTSDCQKFSNAANEINSINNYVAHLVSSLDWEVRGKGNVESLIDQAAAMGKTLSQETARLSQYLNNCAQSMDAADAKLKTDIEKFTGGLPAIIGIGVIGVGIGILPITPIKWIGGIINPNPTPTPTPVITPQPVKVTPIYVSQLPSSKYYNAAYWGGNDPSSGCAAASTSMALSYLGEDVSPSQIIQNNGGTVVMHWAASGKCNIGSDLDQALKNYLSDPSKYAPPIIEMSDRQHFVVVTGYAPNGGYITQDPASGPDTIWNGTAKEVIQYYK